MKIHHIGYLVKNMEKSIEAFQLLGYTLRKEACYDSIRKIDLCFLENDGYAIELVCPVNKESVAWNLLKKYGNSPYHICYETENLTGCIEKFTKQGYVMTAEPEVAVGIEGANVAFLMGRDVGLIELVETKGFK